MEKLPSTPEPRKKSRTSQWWDGKTVFPSDDPNSRAKFFVNHAEWHWTRRLARGAWQYVREHRRPRLLKIFIGLVIALALIGYFLCVGFERKSAETMNIIQKQAGDGEIK
jgi:hypothetical protein